MNNCVLEGALVEDDIIILCSQIPEIASSTSTDSKVPSAYCRKFNSIKETFIFRFRFDELHLLSKNICRRTRKFQIECALDRYGIPE